MTIEYADKKRKLGVFPEHWRGIYEGQDPEQRAAAISKNIDADREAGRESTDIASTERLALAKARRILSEPRS